jgi:MFS family permease
VLGPEVRAEFEEIKTGIAEEFRASAGFKKRELLEPANRYRLLLAFGLFLGQQCTGMTALAYFAPQIFAVLVGDNQSQALLITGLFGAEKFVMCGLYILFFSERFNRRPTFWISPILMATLFIIVCIVNETVFVKTQNRSAGIGTVALIFLTNSIYQFSWGPLPWPYTAEVRSRKTTMLCGMTLTYSTSRSSRHVFERLVALLLSGESWNSSAFVANLSLAIVQRHNRID